MRFRIVFAVGLIAVLMLQATPLAFADGYWDTTIDVLVVESEAFTGFAEISHKNFL